MSAILFLLTISSELFVSSASFLRSDANDTFTSVLTLSSTSNDCLNFSGAGGDSRGVAFNGRTALSADQSDGWLRLNNDDEFSNGIYTPNKIRADGGFHVGGVTVISSTGYVTASRLTGAFQAIDGSALTGISAGATGGGSDEVFVETGQTVTTSYTLSTNKNAVTVSPTINNGVVITVPTGATLVIL